MALTNPCTPHSSWTLPHHPQGIASGYPLAGVAARPELTESLAPGSLGGTYGGNAVACAAAVGTIQVGFPLFLL